MSLRQSLLTETDLMEGDEGQGGFYADPPSLFETLQDFCKHSAPALACECEEKK